MDDAWGLGIRGPWASHLRAVQRGAGELVALFRRHLYAGAGFSHAPTGRRISLFDTFREFDQIPSVRVEDQRLFAYSGTAATAIHFAALMGARVVRLVGIDGTDGYAKCLRRFYDSDAKGGYGYTMSRQAAIDVAYRLGLLIDDRSTNVRERFC